MKLNESASAQASARSQAPAVKKPATLTQWLDTQAGKFAAALPANTIPQARFMQSFKLTVTRNPQLAKCTAESIARAGLQCASLGLDTSEVLGQCYIIPYNEKGVMTAHFQLGYKGMIALARRSNTIKTIAVETVCKNDSFKFDLAMDRGIWHTYNIMEDRGEVIGYYCLVELVNGGVQFAVMSKKDVEAHRAKYAKSWRANDPTNIWNANFDAMAKKTVCIQALKLCPISIESLEAILIEDDSRQASAPVIAPAVAADDASAPFGTDGAEDAQLVTASEAIETNTQVTASAPPVADDELPVF